MWFSFKENESKYKFQNWLGVFVDSAVSMTQCDLVVSMTLLSSDLGVNNTIQFWLSSIYDTVWFSGVNDTGQ